MLVTAVLLSTLTMAQPNFVVLFTDDHRRTAIGALGIEPVHTPNLDSLLEEGTFFSNAYTMGGPHGALCIPSRNMLMTGRNVWHLGQREPQPKGTDGGFINPKHTTWPEVFKRGRI